MCLLIHIRVIFDGEPSNYSCVKYVYYAPGGCINEPVFGIRPSVITAVRPRCVFAVAFPKKIEMPVASTWVTWYKKKNPRWRIINKAKTNAVSNLKSKTANCFLYEKQFHFSISSYKRYFILLYITNSYAMLYIWCLFSIHAYRTPNSIWSFYRHILRKVIKLKWMFVNFSLSKYSRL